MLAAVSAQASVIQKKDPGDSLAQAQNIDNSFSVGANPNIRDSPTNPWVSILAVGNGSFDYFSFTVPRAGCTGTFDIDFGVNPNNLIDTVLALWRVEPDGTHTLLQVNDDYYPFTVGAGGSISGQDAYIAWTFDRPGKYVVGVAEYPSQAVSTGWSQGSAPPHQGASYTLQVCLGAHANPSLGGALLLLLGADGQP